MGQLSTPTLMIAMAATAAERERLLRHIASVPAEVDAEQHLSEQVMDMDHALGELGTEYDAQRNATATVALFPSYEALRASSAQLDY